MRILGLTLLMLLVIAANAPAQSTGITPAQYLQLSRRAQDQNHYPDAKVNAQKAVDGYNHLDQPDSLGEALVMLWSSSALCGMSNSERIPILEKAAQAFEKAGNPQREADCLKEMAELQQITGDFPGSALTLQNALRLYQAANHPQLQGVYDLLCVACNFLNEFAESVRYGLLAIRSAENTRDTSLSLCAYYNHLGSAYNNMRDLPKARLYFTKGLDVARKYKDASGIVIVSANLVRMYCTWEKPREGLEFLTAIKTQYPDFFATYPVDIDINMLGLYDRLHLRDTTVRYAATVEKEIMGKEVTERLRSVGEMALVFHYFTLHDYEKADHWLDACSQINPQMKTPRFAQNELLWHFRVDSAQGQLVSAIRYYQRYKLLGDSILDQAKIRQTEQYNALFESEKKDKNILLLEQQSQTQENSLRHEALLRKVTLGGIALLIMIVGMLYYTLRVKQRSNRLLESQRAEIDRKNQSLQQLVIEKDWLVKEIHHRVKNNLHMVVGLLASQAEYIKGQEAHEAITVSQHRVQAMSLIHQKLYNTENLSSIDMPHYVHELVDYLQSSFDTGRDIRFALDIAKVTFPLSHSIPIGLILNEAITNAIKYAFPGNRKGMITISLKQVAGSQFCLIIRDNGIGIPVDYHRNSSLGISLIEGLSDDIRATLLIKNEEGCTITLIFPVASSMTTN